LVLELPSPQAAPDPRAALAREAGLRAPYPPAARARDRAQAWVRVTLFLVVSVLLFFCVGSPAEREGTHLAEVQAERRLVETRLALAELRAVLADYHADHGRWPGQGAREVSARLLHEQLSLPTDRAGRVLIWQQPRQRTQATLGPYRDGVPANPSNGLATTRFLAADEAWPAEADGTTGWIYRPATGEVRANTPGRASPQAPRFYDL
jgi:hypothetical protein